MRLAPKEILILPLSNAENEKSETLESFQEKKHVSFIPIATKNPRGGFREVSPYFCSI